MKGSRSPWLTRGRRHASQHEGQEAGGNSRHGEARWDTQRAITTPASERPGWSGSPVSKVVSARYIAMANPLSCQAAAMTIGNIATGMPKSILRNPSPLGR
jgi:hypothetical protein